MELTRDTSILVVDDEEMVRGYLKAYFDRDGFTNVTFAIDGDDAIQKLKEGQYDAVVSDYAMGESTGMEVLTAVRTNDRHAKVAFVLMSKGMNTHLRDRARLLGADVCIDKYLDEDFFDRVLESIQKIPSR